MTETESKPKRSRYSKLVQGGALAILVSGLFAFAVTLSEGWHLQTIGSHLTFCKSNLKSIGTAAEMYSTDNSGHYPATLQQLMPTYIQELPRCEAAGHMSYVYTTGEVAYNSPGFKDYYFLVCAGNYHTECSIPSNYPQYDGITGLVER